MEFKEFSEYDNPLEEDYDISVKEDNNTNNNKQDDCDKPLDIGYSNNTIIEDKKVNYDEELIDLIGLIADDEMLDEYGITEEEYLHPTKETLETVREYLLNRKTK